MLRGSVTRYGLRQRPNWAVPVELQQDTRHFLQRHRRETRSVAGYDPKTPEQTRGEWYRSGYHTDIDYELAGYPLCSKITCTAPVLDPDDLAKQVRESNGVTAVRELMTVGLDIGDEQLVRDEYVRPCHGVLSEGELDLPGRINNG